MAYPRWTSTHISCVRRCPSGSGRPVCGRPPHAPAPAGRCTHTCATRTANRKSRGCRSGQTGRRAARRSGRAAPSHIPVCGSRSAESLHRSGRGQAGPPGAPRTAAAVPAWRGTPRPAERAARVPVRADAAQPAVGSGAHCPRAARGRRPCRKAPCASRTGKRHCHVPGS